MVPRRLVLDGRQEVQGLVIDEALLGAVEARARVLSAWCPGTSVSQVGGGEILVLWPEARRLDVGALPGAAVVARDGAWCTLTLDAREWEALAPVPPDALVRARGGVVEVVTAARPAVDVSRWIELGGLVELEASTLGAPPAPIEPPLAAAAVVLRERLLPVGAREVPAGAASVRATLRRAQGLPADEADQAASAVERVPTRAADPAAGRPTWWSRLRSWLGLGRRAPAPARSGAVGIDARSSPEPSPLARAMRRLSRYLQMLPWAGGQSARYLTDMLDKFERGDLTEALRHAIPLGGEARPGEATGFGGLRPRDALDISTGRRAAGGSLAAGEALYAHLRKVYQDAFARLEREGKIPEAAFVLAELLGQSEEAVAFLERHQQLVLAAELAEGRRLDPALVVRQWLLAGDAARAVALARRHGAFAAALTRLERTHPDQARTLRLLWADLRADAGDLAGAVELVWPLDDARPLAAAWIDRGMDVGGVVGARMIAKKLALDPGAYAALLPRVIALGEDPDPHASAAREALGGELLANNHAHARLLSRVVVRALLRDVGRGLAPTAPRDLRALAKHAQDAALAADIPDTRAALPSGPQHFVQLIAAQDVGRTPLFDAARLPNGQLLVACGEGGVRWVTRHGKPVAHFDVPAHRLVVSDHGDRVLALAPRGSLTVVSKIDLHARRARPWLDLPVEGGADTFDGAVWYVREPRAVVALDVLARRSSAVWRVALEGRPRHLTRSPTSLVFVVEGDDKRELWSYQLPSVTLRARRELPPQGACWVGPDGTSAIAGDGHLQVSNAPSRWSTLDAHVTEVALGTRGEVAAALRLGEAVEVQVQERAHVLGRVTLGGSQEVFVRLQGRELLTGDRQGRLVVRSLDDAARRVDLRL